MPPVAFPIIVRIALGAVGAAAVLRWAVKEVRRINEELDRIRKPSATDPARQSMETLRRDPATGEWRVR